MYKILFSYWIKKLIVWGPLTNHCNSLLTTKFSHKLPLPQAGSIILTVSARVGLMFLKAEKETPAWLESHEATQAMHQVGCVSSGCGRQLFTCNKTISNNWVVCFIFVCKHNVVLSVPLSRKGVHGLTCCWFQ